MAIYRLIDEVIFPPPEHAEPNGLLAIGGDLSSERLLEAYRVGIFPWYSEDEPILWWSPDPRLVLDLDQFHPPRRLLRTIRQEKFNMTCDRAFADVISACASVPRPGQCGTWITNEMRDAYIRLHGLGYAHSVEAWHNRELAGGIYGVSLGRAFFGESMFHFVPDASKVALTVLVDQLKQWDFDFLDAQMRTEHMVRFGAKEIRRRAFLRRLRSALNYPTKRGKWRLGG
ncbi:MAG TPA: leucyl/phenylalanyl-tRNA--protein transferase [Candidatus Binatia bacterium]|jgi:leucyl/phenylalanyl-tRNA--protein transferase